MEAERASLSTGPILVEPPQPHSENSSRSSKTSSSDDVFRKLMSTLDGAGVSGKLVRRGKAATVSAVTEDARRVLEQFLKIKYGDSKQGELSDESPYALLVQPPGVGQAVPVPAPPSCKLCPCIPSSRPQQTNSQEDEDGRNDFTDYEKIDESPDYAECADIDTPPGKILAVTSQLTVGGGSHRMLAGSSSQSPGVQLHEVHALKVKSKAKGKAKRKALFDSASSSSTEDYEYPDVELLGRKKKSFFKWASERLRQSFVRQNKKPASGNGDEQESPKAESLPALPTPRSIKKKKDKVTKLQMVAMKRSASEKSKSNSTSPPNQEEVHSDGQLALDRTSTGPLPEETIRYLKSERRPSLAEPVELAESSAKRPWKSPLTRKKQDSVPKKPGEEKERDNRGLFDSLLKQIRKGSQKLKRKGSKQHQRSKSADNLHIRPLSKEHAKVLRRYIEDTEGKEADSDQERHTVHSIHEVSIHRLDGAATLPTSMPRPQLPPPSPLLAGEEVRKVIHHSPPRPMQLEGLVPCTPTPRLKQSDQIDGPSRPTLLPEPANSKPFHLRTTREKEELYERIAEQLAAIADHYNLESPKSPKSSSSPTSHSGHSGPSESETEKLGAYAPRRGHRVRSAELERQLGELLREKGDMANSDIPDPTPVIAELVKNASYSKFKQIVNENIGTDPGWQQLAMMFRFTQTAVQLAGMGTAVALQIKEMTLTYFEDKFAGWIVGQGGWESMVEDTNTEQDSELD